MEIYLIELVEWSKRKRNGLKSRRGGEAWTSGGAAEDVLEARGLVLEAEGRWSREVRRHALDVGASTGASVGEPEARASSVARRATRGRIAL